MSFEDLEREFTMRRRGRRKEVTVAVLFAILVLGALAAALWYFWPAIRG